jgi:hypothetical protein
MANHSTKAPKTLPIHDAIDWFRGSERRAHRRHDLGGREIMVHRVEPAEAPLKIAPSAPKPAKAESKKAKPLGRLLDLSAGGVRLQTTDKTASVGSQIRIRIELPPFAGISPFVDHSGPRIRPKREWTGWMTVVRVNDNGNSREIGARLDDLDELDRGMLSLYLSTQPLAA